MARESPLYIEAMDPVQLHWGKESWKNSLSATSSRLAVTFLAGSAYQYFRPVFYSENTTSIPRLSRQSGEGEEEEGRKEKGGWTMHNALHNNSSPRSLNRSKFVIFFHEFSIWRLNSAPRLLRGKVNQKNCQSSIEKERKGRVDDAQRLAQQFFSTIFKSLQGPLFFFTSFQFDV